MNVKIKILLLILSSSLVTLLIAFLVISSTNNKSQKLGSLNNKAEECKIVECPKSENKAVAFNNSKKTGDTPEANEYFVSQKYHDFSVNIIDGNVTLTYYGNLQNIIENFGYVTNVNDFVFKTDETGYNYLEVSGTSQKVIDAKILLFGQSTGGEVLVMIMEDGTLEYAKMKNLVSSGITEGTISGLTNIVKLEIASAHETNGIGGWMTGIAINGDGYFYDLHYYIPQS